MSLSLMYIKEHSSSDILQARVSSLITYIYGVLNSKYFDQKYRQEVENALAEDIINYLKEIKEAPYTYWVEAMSIHSLDIFNAQMYAAETLTQFINRIYREHTKDE